MVPGAALGRRGFLCCRGPNGGLFIKLLFRFLVGYEGGGDDGDGDGGRRWAFERGFLFGLFFLFSFFSNMFFPSYPSPPPSFHPLSFFIFEGGGGW